MQEFQLDLPKLLYFVKESCHENLHVTLNELRDMTGEIEKNKNHVKGFPIQLPVFLKDFIRKLQRHLALEENNVFPLLGKGTSSISAFLMHLRDDHDDIQNDLLQIRTMTKNYELPIELDKFFKAFYVKLVELDRILQNHIQIENSILFPMILQEAY